MRISDWSSDVCSSDLFYPATDNGYSIGQSSNRISVVYAATGTINTSDADEKDWLATGLSPEEMQAARRIAADIGTYRWLSSVAEKGEEDRKSTRLNSSH